MIFTVGAGDRLTYLLDGILAHAQRVGTHVRDEPHRTPVLAEIDPFVQPLRDLHRALGREPEIARRVLLKLGRGIGSGSFAPLFAPGDLGDRVARALEVGAYEGGRRLLLDLELFATSADQPGHEARTLLPNEPDPHVPVLFRNEGFDLPLPIDDEPQRDRLHAPCG